MIKCMKGCDSVEFNSKGDCCCNCKYNHKVCGHPWNVEPLNSSISEQIYYAGAPLSVCSAESVMGCGSDVILFTKAHGMCELHSRKEDSND